MGKLNGVSTFTALYTVLTEYEEIRLQVHTPTRSLEHLASPFGNKMQSHKNYGFRMPQVFYTDNVNGDKNLERWIPSRLSNVEHIIAPSQEELIARNCDNNHL